MAGESGGALFELRHEGVQPSLTTCDLSNHSRRRSTAAQEPNAKRNQLVLDCCLHSSFAA